MEQNIDINVPNNSPLLEHAIEDCKSMMKPETHRCIKVPVQEILGYELFGYSLGSKLDEISLGIVTGLGDKGVTFDGKNGWVLYHGLINYEAQVSR